MSKKLLTVFGATGNQGGSVIDVVLNSPELSAKYSLRGVTRDPSKPDAQKLAERGVEVVTADLKDRAAVQKATEGAYGVFGVTDYWALNDGAAEEAQGVAIADGAIASGVKHLVWSSLPSPLALSGGKYRGVHHFESKARVEAYIEANKTKAKLIATYYMPASFMTMVRGSINPGQDGVPTFATPLAADAQFPLIDNNRDSGKYIVGAFEAGEAADGAHIQGVGSWSTPRQLTQTIESVTGTKINVATLPPEVFKGFLPPAIADDLTEMFVMIGDIGYYGTGASARQEESDRFLVAGSKKVGWKEYVEQNGPWEWGSK